MFNAISLPYESSDEIFINEKMLNLVFVKNTSSNQSEMQVVKCYARIVGCLKVNCKAANKNLSNALLYLFLPRNYLQL